MAFKFPTKVAPFTLKDGSLFLNGSPVVRPAGNTLVIHTLARQTAEPAVHQKLDEIVALALKAKMTIEYSVKGLRAFFDPKARWAAFLASGETSGVQLTDDEKAAVKAIESIRAKFEATFGLPTPPYPFAAVPEGVDPMAKLTVKTTGSRPTVTRGNYTISLKRAKILWLQASKLWLANETKKQTGRLAYGTYTTYAGYSRSPDIRPNSIDIGCQTINRYELEALALNQGWEFPTGE